MKHCFITRWTFIFEFWCNGLLKCVPFTYQKKLFGDRYTLMAQHFLIKPLVLRSRPSESSSKEEMRPDVLFLKDIVNVMWHLMHIISVCLKAKSTCRVIQWWNQNSFSFSNFLPTKVYLYTLSVKRNITSSGRCSLKSMRSKLKIFGHK